MSSSSSSPLPLSGITVLDMSRLYPGPLCTLMLSDMGATVIKLEDSTAGGDMLRRMGGQAMFVSLNRGKQCVNLNLKPPRANRKHLDDFWKLVLRCDVLVESFKPGVLERLLGVSDLRSELEQKLQRMAQRFGCEYRGLIVARISAFGNYRTNTTTTATATATSLEKWKRFPAHDFNLAARAGMFMIPRVPDNSDIAPLPVQVVDLMAAQSCCSQILAALLWRGRHNTQQHRLIVIDVSMYDMALASMIMPLSIMLSSGKSVSNGRDVLCGSVPCYDIYKTGEGWISVGCLEPQFWSGFIEVLGLDRQQFDAVAAFSTGKRKQHIKAVIEEKLSAKTAREWEEIFVDKNLPILALRSSDEVASDPLVHSRKMITEVQGDGSPSFRTINPPLDYACFLAPLSSRGPNSHHTQAVPSIGHHDEVVLSRL